jgi:hypothetical protein
MLKIEHASIATVKRCSQWRTLSSPLENKFACTFVVSCGSTSSTSLDGISREFAGRFFSQIFADRDRPPAARRVLAGEMSNNATNNIFASIREAPNRNALRRMAKLSRGAPVFVPSGSSSLSKAYGLSKLTFHQVCCSLDTVTLLLAQSCEALACIMFRFFSSSPTKQSDARAEPHFDEKNNHPKRTKQIQRLLPASGIIRVRLGYDLREYISAPPEARARFDR